MCRASYNHLQVIIYFIEVILRAEKSLNFYEALNFFPYILRLVDMIQGIFNLSLLLQLSFALPNIALYIYVPLKTTEDPVLVYECVIAFTRCVCQLFLYCWIGTDVTTKVLIGLSILGLPLEITSFVT